MITLGNFQILMLVASFAVVGAILGRFKAPVLLPAIMVLFIVFAGSAFIRPNSMFISFIGWIAATTALQLGYLFRIALHGRVAHVLRAEHKQFAARIIELGSTAFWRSAGRLHHRRVQSH